MKLVSYATRDLWLEARKLGLGGSDVPAVLGTSPWRTPLMVWSEKVGLLEQSKESYALRRGQHMEDLLYRELRSEVPFQGLEHLTLVAVVGSEKWMRYSPDGFGYSPGRDYHTLQPDLLVEFKSHPRGASEWSEGAPPHVVDQVQYGMVVCDLPACYVAVDLGTEFRWVRIERDPDWWAKNEAALRAFWELVETQEPPAPTGAEGDRDVLAALYPREQSGLSVPLPDECFDLAMQYDEAAKAKSAAQRQMDEIGNRIVAAMGDAERAVLPDGSGWTLRTTTVAAEEKPRAGWSKRVLRRVKRKES